MTRLKIAESSEKKLVHSEEEIATEAKETCRMAEGRKKKNSTGVYWVEKRVIKRHLKAQKKG